MRLALVGMLVLAALVVTGSGMGPGDPAAELQLVFTTDAAVDGSRELHLVSLDGKGATPLTRHEPQAHELSYAPDGRSIVFTAGGEAADALWLASSDGRARRRVAARKAWGISAVVPSPDGRTIAVVDGAQDLWLVDTGTGKLRRVPAASYVWDVTWSPDGGRLAFSHGSTESSGVSVIRPDGSGSRRITPPQTPAESIDEFLATDLRWAPDGSAVAYAWGAFDSSEIRVVSVAGGRSSRVGIGETPAWSPDARRVGFVRGRSIVVADRNGLGRRVLARAEAPPSALTWSADGGRIGFLAGDPPLRELDVGSGRIRILTRPLRVAARARHPQWSPRGDAAVAGGPFLAGVGTKWRRVLQGGTDSAPSWSRDGRLVAFQRDRGNRSSIMLLRVGGGPSAVTTGRRPRIAPDGSRIAFYRDSGLFLWSRGTVTRVGPTSDGVEWSPDGTRLTWTVGNAVYVAEPGGAGRLLTRNRRCDGEREADVGSATWSPDGRTISFSVEHADDACTDLVLVEVASGSTRSLGRGTSPRWSPDGTALAVVDPYEAIRIVSRSGTLLGRWEGDEPSWAPDGSWVAYSKEVGRSPSSVSDVWVRRRDGSGARRVTSGRGLEAEPTFRPASG